MKRLCKSKCYLPTLIFLQNLKLFWVSAKKFFFVKIPIYLLGNFLQKKPVCKYYLEASFKLLKKILPFTVEFLKKKTWVKLTRIFYFLLFIINSKCIVKEFYDFMVLLWPLYCSLPLNLCHSLQRTWPLIQFGKLWSNLYRIFTFSTCCKIITFWVVALIIIFNLNVM